MIYTLYFTSQGAPKTGLTPTIITLNKISDGAAVAVTPSAWPTVSEIAGGLYKFTLAFPFNSLSEALGVVVDGGATLANPERYKVMQITPNDGSLDAAVSTRATVATILAGNVEDSITVAHAMQAILAACAGKSDGGGSTTIHFRDQADSKNRITATVDSNGDRTAITLSYD